MTTPITPAHKMANNNSNNLFRKLAPALLPSTLKAAPILLNDFGAKRVEKDYLAKFGQNRQVQLLDLIYETKNLADPNKFLTQQPLPVPTLIWFHGSGQEVKGTVSAGKPGLHIYIAYNPVVVTKTGGPDVELVGIVVRQG